MNAKIEFKGETYSLFDAGSGSGYMLRCSGITKCDFDRLYGEEQHEINEYDWDRFEDSICTLLGKFIESCAKESWESQEDDDYHMHILIDGVEQEGEAQASSFLFYISKHTQNNSKRQSIILANSFCQ